MIYNIPVLLWKKSWTVWYIERYSVNIYESYKLLKTVRFFWPTLYMERVELPHFRPWAELRVVLDLRFRSTCSNCDDAAVCKSESYHLSRLTARQQLKPHRIFTQKHIPPHSHFTLYMCLIFQPFLTSMHVCGLVNTFYVNQALCGSTACLLTVYAVANCQ